MNTVAKEQTKFVMSKMQIPIPSVIEELIRKRYADSPVLHVGVTIQRDAISRDGVPALYTVSDVDPLLLLEEIRDIINNKRLDLADKIMDVHVVLQKIEKTHEASKGY